MQQCIISAKGKNFKKNFGGGDKFGLDGPKSAPKLVFFGHFFKFGLLVFLEIAYDDSLQHCQITSGGCGVTSIGSEIRVFVIFPWYCTRLQLRTMSYIKLSWNLKTKKKNKKNIVA